eukprot:TRINITY_DN5187_c0_g1_i1.p1 TRINITY_DN5187_c0_g1~~TRINITY_DN5187_c0_g1_i1.p1  ORF type:complete len:366 (+),score=101.31 TRINITY_DN5187_c0_g1_i1:22-1119(+)
MAGWGFLSGVTEKLKSVERSIDDALGVEEDIAANDGKSEEGNEIIVEPPIHTTPARPVTIKPVMYKKKAIVGKKKAISDDINLEDLLNSDDILSSPVKNRKKPIIIPKSPISKKQVVDPKPQPISPDAGTDEDNNKTSADEDKSDSDSEISVDVSEKVEIPDSVTNEAIAGNNDDNDQIMETPEKESQNDLEEVVVPNNDIILDQNETEQDTTELTASERDAEASEKKTSEADSEQHDREQLQRQMDEISTLQKLMQDKDQILHERERQLESVSQRTATLTHENQDLEERIQRLVNERADVQSLQEEFSARLAQVESRLSATTKNATTSGANLPTTPRKKLSLNKTGSSKRSEVKAKRSAKSNLS